jgi:peptidoglycan/xylan/chitin deacetylase (PgdA/CDA1 family)
MAGWRVGMVVGNERICAALARVKSYLDYGAYTPIQVAAAAALNGPQDCVDDIRGNYKSRRDVLVKSMKQAGWEIASHGLKWIDHRDMPEEAERAAIAEAIRLHTEVVGTRPTGWYTGRCSVNTVRLTAEQRFDWISDTYDDDLPYWIEAGDRDQLVIPYTLEANDMRFATAPGYIEGEQFFQYLKDSFDTLYAEGETGQPKMLSIGLHCRLIGRPGKIAGLIRFLDHAQARGGVWFATRQDIARHWAASPAQPSERLTCSGLGGLGFMLAG